MIEGGGHHAYAQYADEFNTYVNAIASVVDRIGQSFVPGVTEECVQVTANKLRRGGHGSARRSTPGLRPNAASSGPPYGLPPQTPLDKGSGNSDAVQRLSAGGTSTLPTRKQSQPVPSTPRYNDEASDEASSNS